MTFLLDTNTVIYLINDRLGMALPDGRYGFRFITEIELLSFRIGIAKGEFTVPDDIDPHNDEVARLFLEGPPADAPPA